MQLSPVCCLLSSPAALKQPKQALWCRGQPLVVSSVYRSEQCAGDANYQQVTAAAPMQCGPGGETRVLRVQLCELEKRQRRGQAPVLQDQSTKGQPKRLLPVHHACGVQAPHATLALSVCAHRV